MNIFEAIRQDHEKQRSLLKILAETSGDTPARQEYYQELKDQLESHAIAEERFFYSPLIDTDEAIELSRHGMAEHHEIDELLEKLDETDMSSSGWLHHLKALQELVEHHFNDEEQDFFPIADKVLSKQQKNHLAKEYRDEMQAELHEH
ncbi:hemerythrin domain-containing protein [Alteromonas pelagimontana]|uniref:Hemerythrin domain-containing protein n=1 Tax=Alteromonas pelagimontana TaxID=1858656 RepID=A0A6M4MGZ4_9ALTE|nr:hemerythrin domain-containing protein [Alteromonas pelagimontana]QJR82481.1 hemerythrin domain-containing protein [Alteromonas pelagimontana]